MEKAMRLMSAVLMVGSVAACNGADVTGPTIVGPGPAAQPGPGPDMSNGADIQGSGNLATESFEVSGFARVRLQGVGHLIIEQAGSESLRITADDNILPLVSAQVYGDELVLGTDPETTFASANSITYELSVVSLEALAVLGAAHAEIWDLDAESFYLHLEGAAAAMAEGRADAQQLTLRGTAHYDGRALHSRAVHVDIAGVSEGTVRVSESLQGWIDGRSSLEYIGDPTVSVTTSGGATVQQGEG
jgi:hypothetical protein